jgi:rhodanese-related sulfurtransferase
MKISKPTRIAMWTGFGISAMLLAVWWFADHRRGMKWAMSVVSDRFPDVPQLPTESLATWLADVRRPAPCVVDTRSAEEFDVSHLAGAERLDPSAADSELEMRFRKDQPLVLYCATGYRGSQMVRRLQTLGFRNASNLAGGIFQWVNEGREIRQDGAVATEVHPIHRAFARLLRPESRKRS